MEVELLDVSCTGCYRGKYLVDRYSKIYFEDIGAAFLLVRPGNVLHTRILFSADNPHGEDLCPVLLVYTEKRKCEVPYAVTRKR